MERCEQRLVEHVKRRDRVAQGELYHRYAGQLLSVSVRYVGKAEVAEDILHDAFIKIFRAIDTFVYRGDGSLRAWMERIVINTALEWLRLQKRIDVVSYNDDYTLTEIETTDPTSDDIERIPQNEILKLIAELPDGYRTVFNLYMIEGHSHREIAKELGINEKSSSSQLLRAKKLLAKKINKYISDNE